MGYDNDSFIFGPQAILVVRPQQKLTKGGI